MTVDTDSENVLDVFGDAYARSILTALSGTPRSAKELCECCDLSPPTVYRRLRTLEAHGLVRARTRVAADGNHFQVFETAFTTAHITLRDGTLSARLVDAAADSTPQPIPSQED
ncbi:helix-turn-helix domain-containing protein [Haladaptatus sp. GCM10025707]|uniref:winged helix-turn-helix domain-containing protein n=1 Tax=unclassified Haladaptatus TaxID=2622732 RepID=UPI0023E7679F|nr:MULTISPECIES: winged helix-turn-helix domain-containing protein [unclassified Haladaptatus]